MNEGRYSGSAEDRDYGYGSYTDTDEGDSSVRAGSYDQGRERRSTAVRATRRAEWFNRPLCGLRRGGYGQGRYSRPGTASSVTAIRPHWAATARPLRSPRATAMNGSGGESEGGRYSQGTFGTERGGWSEPYGEGQQYTSRGDYAGSVQSGYSGRGTGEHGPAPRQGAEGFPAQR